MASAPILNVIGQGHITRALRNALIQDRIRHAYLFNRPRSLEQNHDGAYANERRSGAASIPIRRRVRATNVNTASPSRRGASST
ncbi:MAG: hypothetical protein U0528_13330 [Anaerolineae bacterium]